MLPFKRNEEGVGLSTYTLFGKLANRADFLRVNAKHGIVDVLDHACQACLEKVAENPLLQQAYDSGRSAELMMISDDGRDMAVGVAIPSRDQAGRRFPLVALMIISASRDVNAGILAPLEFEHFNEELALQLQSTAAHSRDAESCRTYLDAVLQERHTVMDDASLASHLLDQFVKSTPATHLDDLLRRVDSEVALRQAILNIAFYRAFLRRFSNPASHQLLMLPLPDAHGERVLFASAWLSLLHCLGQGTHPASVPVRAYVIAESAGKKATLFACFDRFHEALAESAFACPADHLPTLGLGKAHGVWKSHPLYPEVAYALDRLLADPALTIFGLLEFARKISQKLDTSIYN